MFCPNCGRDCGVSRVCPVCGYVSGGEDSGSAEGKTDVLADILPLLEEREGEYRPLTRKGSGIIPTARLVCPNCGRQYEARIRGTAGKKRRLAPAEYREYPQEREKDDIPEDVRPLLRQREENSRTVQEEIRRRQSPAPILVCPHCGTQITARKNALPQGWGMSSASDAGNPPQNPKQRDALEDIPPSLTGQKDTSRGTGVTCPKCGSMRYRKRTESAELIWYHDPLFKLLALILHFLTRKKYGPYRYTCLDCRHQWKGQ